MNEYLNIEYGDGTDARYGCGATLHNVFWYFGGYYGYQRQVKLQKHLFDIYLNYFRQVKLLDASSSVRPIWTLIFTREHAIHSINLKKKSYFASIMTITDNATRKYFCETFIIY